MAMAVDQVHMLTIWTQSGDQGGLMTRHYRVSSITGVGATEQEVVDAMSSFWDAFIKPMLTNTATYDGCTLQKVKPLPKGNRYVSFNDAGAGTAGTDPLPRQVSGVISLRTALAGREFRGRVYMPFPDESDSDADNPSVGYQVALAALAAELDNNRVIIGAGGSTTLVPVIYSRKLDQVNDIVQAIARSTWGTQRRRGSFGQPNKRLAV